MNIVKFIRILVPVKLLRLLTERKFRLSFVSLICGRTDRKIQEISALML